MLTIQELRDLVVAAAAVFLSALEAEEDMLRHWEEALRCLEEREPTDELLHQAAHQWYAAKDGDSWGHPVVRAGAVQFLLGVFGGVHEDHDRIAERLGVSPCTWASCLEMRRKEVVRIYELRSEVIGAKGRIRKLKAVVALFDDNELRTLQPSPLIVAAYARLVGGGGDVAEMDERAESRASTIVALVNLAYDWGQCADLTTFEGWGRYGYRCKPWWVWLAKICWLDEIHQSLACVSDGDCDGRDVQGNGWLHGLEA